MKILKKLIIVLPIIVAIILIINTTFYKKEGSEQVISEEQSDINPKYEITSYVTEKMRNEAKKFSPIVCFAQSFNEEYLLGKCTDIAIVRMFSEEYMELEKTFLGMTVGKMLVNNTIYGDLKEGIVVKYIKPGGYIDMETWNNAQPEAAKDRRLKTREIMGITTSLNEEYINTVIPEDVEIELGKTYFVYLNYIESMDLYEIIGLGKGFRELNIPKEDEYVSRIEIDINNAQILNNETGKFESLKEYIDKYINK